MCQQGGRHGQRFPRAALLLAAARPAAALPAAVTASPLSAPAARGHSRLAAAAPAAAAGVGQQQLHHHVGCLAAAQAAQQQLQRGAAQCQGPARLRRRHDAVQQACVVGPPQVRRRWQGCFEELQEAQGLVGAAAGSTHLAARCWWVLRRGDAAASALAHRWVLHHRGESLKGCRHLLLGVQGV